MIRYFFKPTAIKILFSLLMTLITYYAIIANLLPTAIQHENFFVKLGAVFAYVGVPNQSPALRFGVIFTFWSLISWIMYTGVWGIEYLYVKLYNYALSKRLFPDVKR